MKQSALEPHKHVIWVADRLAAEAAAVLQEQPDVCVRRGALGELEMADVEGLLVRSQVRVDEGLLARLPSLKVVVTATSGFDHLDLAALERRRITAMFCPEGNAQSAAELTWALILACAKTLLPAREQMRRGDWNRAQLLGFEVSGKTLGLIGLGRVGARVARIARAFALRVLAFDPYQEDEVFAAHEVERVGFEEVLCTSDIVSFHVPLTKRTYHMLNRSTLEMLAPGAWIINASRGPVICEDSLLAALAEGHVAGAGLDVFAREPLDRASRLLQLPQVVTTPHIGANTHEAFLRVSHLAVQKTLEFLRSGTALDTLPPPTQWWKEDNA